MKSCIEEVGKFLSQQEIMDFWQQIVSLLVDSDKRKTENDNFKAKEDMEVAELLVGRRNQTSESR